MITIGIKIHAVAKNEDEAELCGKAAAEEEDVVFDGDGSDWEPDGGEAGFTVVLDEVSGVAGDGGGDGISRFKPRLMALRRGYSIPLAPKKSSVSMW